MSNLLFDLPEEIIIKIMRMNPRPFHSELRILKYISVDPRDRDYDLWWLFRKNSRLAEEAEKERKEEEERERDRRFRAEASREFKTKFPRFA